MWRSSANLGQASTLRGLSAILTASAVVRLFGRVAGELHQVSKLHHELWNVVRQCVAVLGHISVEVHAQPLLESVFATWCDVDI